MYIQKIQDFILYSLSKTYQNVDLKTIENDGPIVQKSPDSIKSDFGSSLALRLAKLLKKPPIEIANNLSTFLNKNKPDFIDEITVLKPGYINFSINKKDIASKLKNIALEVNTLKKHFDKQSETIQIEFVSANPTGPLHVGHIRGAVYGSALSKVLSFYGYNMKNEYYVNDAGNQITEFGESILNKILKSNKDDTSDSYKGEYILDLANDIQKELNLNSKNLTEEVTKIGINKMLTSIKNDLSKLNVKFDEWFHESQLFKDKTLDEVIKKLNEKEFISQKEGATWFLSKKLGDDRDNVLIKKDSSHTYFFSDIANHYNKFFIRNFNKVINIWGADHQGHIKRTKLAMESLGVESENLIIKISQMVTIKKGTEIVKISKRSGEYVTLSEIVEEVGSDACRYFFLSKSPDTQLTFDIELAKSQNSSNPIFYIQYAHARLIKLLESAKKAKIEVNKDSKITIDSEKELEIGKKILEFPEMIEQIVKELEPHHITRYCLELASLFHSYYQSEKIIDDSDNEISESKILFCNSVLNTIRQCLDLMMISAPKKM
tara:strand:- start:1605 stop:3248 length:1644 start_codon:yes stop_codon:yes gene_type:complete